MIEDLKDQVPVVGGTERKLLTGLPVLGLGCPLTKSACASCGVCIGGALGSQEVRGAIVDGKIDPALLEVKQSDSRP